MYVKWDDSNRRFQQVIHILLYAVLWKFYLSLHTNLLEPIKVLQMGIFAISQEEQSKFNCTAFWGYSWQYKELTSISNLTFFSFTFLIFCAQKELYPHLDLGLKSSSSHRSFQCIISLAAEQASSSHVHGQKKWNLAGTYERPANLNSQDCGLWRNGSVSRARKAPSIRPHPKKVSWLYTAALLLGPIFWAVIKMTNQASYQGRLPAEEEHYLWASLTHRSTWSVSLPFFPLAAAEENGSRALNNHKAC